MSVAPPNLAVEQTAGSRTLTAAFGSRFGKARQYE